MLKFWGFWIVCAIVIMGLTGCSNESESQGEAGGDKPLVVCTTGMIADIARNLGEPYVEVVALMGPETDPHLYKPTEGDLQRLSQADLILYNGLHLEGKMGEVLEKLGQSRKVVGLGEFVDKQRLRYPPNAQGNPDPHLWHDVSLWEPLDFYVQNALTELLPERADYFRQQAVKYRQTLLELHRWVKAQIESIPKPQRALVTAHDAFGYFGAAYGIEVKALQGISTVSDYGLKDVENLVNFITKRQIKAIFAETSISNRSVQAVIAGCKAKGHTVQMGGTLYSDALGPEGSGAETYEGMIRANVKTIVEGLK